MIKSITTSALIALASCPPIGATPTTSEGTDPIACPAGIVQLTETDELPNCDMNGTQTWVWYLDETQVDFDDCYHAGGAIMHDLNTDRYYCIDIDY